MIEVGRPVPEPRLTDTTGAEVRLSDHRGGGVLVYFMRHTGCPMCNLHVKHLAAHAADYAAHGVAVLVAVPDEPDTASRWAAAKKLPFPVVIGAGSTPHAGVGLARTVFGSMQRSGTVLVDHAGVVRYLRIATMPTGGYSHRAVMRAIEDLHRARTDR
ncbi:redoxin domain-containing protein [Pseudonocardia acaciae]|uniref:redoxin domain-containing protein n=1 Tax=Pseudonocardia acaciae TaxID=551276 RepID=UPI0004921409|nr:redoxin domain-containing protein [Pseudonocardia acaciae]